MGTIEGSVAGIVRALEEGAVTMQRGGGIGYDFPTVWSRGFRIGGAGAVASGPVSSIKMWDAMCRAIRFTDTRRGR
jgi:ribonucleoside-diphosphate reductase alpha chain